MDCLLNATDAYKVESPAFRRNVERAISHGFPKGAVVDMEHAALVESTVKWFDKHKDDPDVGGKFVDPILILTDAYSKSKIRRP